MSSSKCVEKVSCGCNYDDTGEEALSMCIAHDSTIDQETTEKHDLTRNVWEQFRPPSHFTTAKPTVTARQLDITRKMLDGSDAKGSKNNSNKTQKKLKIPEDQNSSR